MTLSWPSQWIRRTLSWTSQWSIWTPSWPWKWRGRTLSWQKCSTWKGQIELITRINCAGTTPSACRCRRGSSGPRARRPWSVSSPGSSQVKVGWFHGGVAKILNELSLQFASSSPPFNLPSPLSNFHNPLQPLPNPPLPLLPPIFFFLSPFLSLFLFQSSYSSPLWNPPFPLSLNPPLPLTRSNHPFQFSFWSFLLFSSRPLQLDNYPLSALSLL